MDFAPSSRIAGAHSHCGSFHISGCNNFPYAQSIGLHPTCGATLVNHQLAEHQNPLCGCRSH
jgi:hypothetical protein